MILLPVLALLFTDDYAHFSGRMEKLKYKPLREIIIANLNSNPANLKTALEKSIW